jgi:NitT/TauT family transport system ATP-binding protein
VPQSSGAAVEANGVRKVYWTRGAETVALDEVSFRVARGEFVTVVGRSGCGKTTLLKLISGLLPASAGQVAVEGRAVRAPLRNIGLVFQSPVLLKWRTVLKNVMLPVEILGMERGRARAQALELIKLVGLEGFETKYPRELSGGMQQRVSLCRALVHNPPLLLMDEPFGALDALTREEMNQELLRIWQDQAKTTLLITHSISEAIFLGDRVIVMTPRPGRILEIVPVPLPRPRTPAIKLTPEFNALVRRISELLGIKYG